MRDYSKEPIFILDESEFDNEIPLSVVSIFIMITWVYVLFTHIPEDKFVDGACIYTIVWFIGVLIAVVTSKQKMAIFKFTDEKVEYFRFARDINPDYIEMLDERKACTKDIKQISFCIKVELRHRYGRKHYLGTFKRSAIALPLEKLLDFTLYLISYLLVLPMKIYKLKKTKEPLWLLRKNIVIEFTNRNYFIVNVHSEKILDELFGYFKSKNIPIENKTAFVYHCQPDARFFFDKEENWCDEFEPQKVEKRGIIKKIANLFGFWKRDKL